MTYESAVDFLFHVAPSFQQVGQAAYKPGLQNMQAFDERLGHPHKAYKTIHIAGTNGKGSVSHTLASMLQEAGYKTGLFTSPHLIDFRERIRVNGQTISKKRVVEFIDEHKQFIEELRPSFFEITTALAFTYFKEQQVDVAVIETGLGGLLDSTNIIAPEFCVITNIAKEHTKQLGNTLREIAGQKAGIIKDRTPVVVGERKASTAAVFREVAERHAAPIFFATPQLCLPINSETSAVVSENDRSRFEKRAQSFRKTSAVVLEKEGQISAADRQSSAADRQFSAAEENILEKEGHRFEKGRASFWKTKGIVSQNGRSRFYATPYGIVESPLTAGYQIANANTVVHAVPLLMAKFPQVTLAAVRRGFRNVLRNTHLLARWQTVAESPRVVLDNAHNPHAFVQMAQELAALSKVGRPIHVVLAFCADKNVKQCLRLLPQTEQFHYYFTQFGGKRALPAEQLFAAAKGVGLIGVCCPVPREAVALARQNASPEDTIVITGSSYLNAEILKEKAYLP